MTNTLAGMASTQSRGRRPLPPGALSAKSLGSHGALETVEFQYHVRKERRELLTWVVGQHGCLWFNGPYPREIQYEIDNTVRLPMSYGASPEYALTGVLGEIFDGYLTSDALATRFFQNGSDACAAAARVARYVTGRNYIASFGYHGSHSDYAHLPGDKGIPPQFTELHTRFEWGDVDRARECARIAAALVLEVPAVDDEEAQSFLFRCRLICDEQHIPLIIDDVVLGFRVALAGSSEKYHVRPDMICLGKSMSATGGMAALIGRDDMVGTLANPVFYSTTFGGTPGACNVSVATLKWLKENRQDVYGWRDELAHSRGHLSRIGTVLKTELNDVFAENGIKAKCVGQPERSSLVFEDGEESRRAWCSQMIERGVMMDRPQFPTLVHTTEDVEKTLEVARRVK